MIKDRCDKMIHFFGYSKREDNPYGFFDFEGKASIESEKEFEGFKELNKKTWEWISSDKKSIESMKYGINQGKEGFKIFVEKEVTEYQNMPSRAILKD